jgi:hypothetical protein
MKKIAITAVSLFIVLLSAITMAQSSNGDFEITKSTIDSGGGISSNGEYALTGTIGQADANQQISKGGNFALAGGFWANSSVINVIFKNGFEAN